MATVAEALTAGSRHQQAGQLAEAERAYRRALAIDPENAHALHLLGTVAIQAGQFQQAIELIRDAVRRDRSQAAFHANLAEAYRLSGDLASAVTSNQNAIKLQPQLIKPHENLGHLYYQQGDFARAAECFRQMVRLAPDDPAARIALARTLKQLGKPAEAEACLRRAVRTAPDNGKAHELLGLALLDQRKFDEARASFETALAIDPGNASAHNNLGNALKELHLLGEAESQFREAIRLDPGMSAAPNNLGALLLDQARFDEAVGFLNRATELDPSSFQAYCNLARVLDELGQLDRAIAASRRTIELNPVFAYGYCNLGTTLKNLGRLDEAIEAYRKALELDPQSAIARSDLVYSVNFHAGYDAAAIFAEHLEWGRMQADPLTAASRPATNDRRPDRRLRLGYVSAHFWGHAVNFFTEPILASHDHDAVEVFCYSNNSSPDETNARLKKYADGWREIGSLTDAQAAERVRADGIDILVDLSGHIAGNRLGVFARKPAPVQVTYIGYQNTTGMQAMDYRLTDAWADPPGTTDEFYTEKLVRLPRSFFCYRPSPDAPPVGEPPSVANGYVTFGSFNHFGKVTPEVLTTWARILQAVPRSRLVVVAHAVDSLRAYLNDTFTSLGIEQPGWVLADRRPRAEYLQLIQQVDVALDPFPFNGHTTTCDALWQGVPVVTLAGRMYAGRFGSSAHVNLGLRDLIAESPDEYVEIARRLADDVPRLAELRAGLREVMSKSPLLDFAGFARNLEAAYRQMWNDWCTAAPV